MNKKEYRKKYIDIRNNLSDSYRKSAEKEIFDKFVSSNLFNSANSASDSA